jgi:hypothetical protein
VVHCQLTDLLKYGSILETEELNMWKIRLYETLMLENREEIKDAIIANKINEMKVESLDEAKQSIEMLYLWRPNKIWKRNEYISYLDSSEDFPIVLASIEEV